MAGKEVSAWVDLSGRGGEVAVHVPYLPAEALTEGRLPACYPILSFRVTLLSSDTSSQEDVEPHIQEQADEEDVLPSLREKRHFFPQECDSHNSVVIGLAVGLGVTGTYILPSH
jgi:hypothetical protein